VVDHSVESIIVARWPGRLWRVQVLDLASEADMKAAGAGNLRSDAGYVRAIAVAVVDELPVSGLFGPHGHAVCSVIEAAMGLEVATVELLARARHTDGGQAYSRAWNAWLDVEDHSSPHRGGDHSRTLAITAGRARSPINSGLCVLSTVFNRRARCLAGDTPFVVDDECETALEPMWGRALDAILEAAMALGAPELVNSTDHEVLTAAWRAVIAPDIPRE
jgi:hypothetical protein